MKFPQLTAEDIEVRPAQVLNGAVTLLLYKNARVDMRILDETVGLENWQKEFYECKGNLFCRVGIKVDGEWVWKADCGAESNMDKEKGEASDAFKRACFNFGIGRELYTAPFIYIKLTDADMKNGKLATRFKVGAIGYKDGKINELTIWDNKNNIRFDMWGKQPRAIAKPDERMLHNINRLVEETKTDITALCKHYGVKSIEELTIEQGIDCTKILESKRK